MDYCKNNFQLKPKFVDEHIIISFLSLKPNFREYLDTMYLNFFAL